MGPNPPSYSYLRRPARTDRPGPIDGATVSAATPLPTYSATPVTYDNPAPHRSELAAGADADGHSGRKRGAGGRPCPFRYCRRSAAGATV